MTLVMTHARVQYCFRERADGLHARRVVRVDREVGVEELVRLAHGHLEREPLARRRDVLRDNVVLREPRVDGVDARLARRNELLDL